MIVIGQGQPQSLFSFLDNGPMLLLFMYTDAAGWVVKSRATAYEGHFFFPCVKRLLFSLLLASGPLSHMGI